MTVRIFKAIGWALVVIVVAIAVVFIGARFQDGPLGMIPGGALTSGQWLRTNDLDWSFINDVDERPQMQLLSSNRSRTLSMVYKGGSLFLPCGRPLIRQWKKWCHEAMEDGRAVLRIEDKRYAVHLRRATENERLIVLAHETQEHDLDPIDTADPDLLWVFRADARTRSSDE